MWSRERVEALVERVGSSGGACGERGSGLSSREKMERSSPFQLSPHSWLFCDWLAIGWGEEVEGTDLSRVHPQCITVGATALQGEVVGVHGERLAGVVSRLVCVFVVHVIGYTDFGE